MSNPSTPELRKLLEKHCSQFDQVSRLRQALMSDLNRPIEELDKLSYPKYPKECQDMTCGAKTRAGTACKRRDLWSNGRCRLHGGLSTGPRTEQGKKRSSQNGLRPKRKRSP